MADFGTELIGAAREKFGQPFLHHFQPDQCEGGRLTRPGCWERGLDKRGYDCSGFVIASICEVMDISVDAWPRNQRHIKQMLAFTDVTATAAAGDVVITQDPSDPKKKHMGVYVGNGAMLHADGRPSVSYVNQSLIDTCSSVTVYPIPTL